jgi:hypothetical protein
MKRDNKKQKLHKNRNREKEQAQKKNKKENRHNTLIAQKEIEKYTGATFTIVKEEERKKNIKNVLIPLINIFF